MNVPGRRDLFLSLLITSEIHKSLVNFIKLANSSRVGEINGFPLSVTEQYNSRNENI